LQREVSGLSPGGVGLKIPTVLSVITGNSGVAYWRVYSWWNSAKRTGKMNCAMLGWEKQQDYSAPWQFDIADANHQPRLFGMLYSGGQQADAIVFQRVETDAALTTFYAMKDQFPDKPILMEIDDDVTDVAAYNQAHGSFKPGSNLLNIAIAQMRACDGLIVSTPYLKEVYSEFCPNIYVVPNSIDVQRWDKVQRKKKPGIRIGWMGSTSHAEDLEIVASIIPEILEKHKDVTFVFGSGALPDFLKGIERVEVLEKWVPILKYPQHLAHQDFDIGMAPLRDNKFNRAKSNLRWLELAALGIPCVASNVGHFKETLRHGKDVLLAENANEFSAHLSALISSVSLRKQIGSAAKARVYEDFNTDKNLDLFVAAVNDCLNRPAKPAPSIMTGVDDMIGVAEPQDMPGVEMGPLEMVPELPVETSPEIKEPAIEIIVPPPVHSALVITQIHSPSGSYQPSGSKKIGLLEHRIMPDAIRPELLAEAIFPIAISEEFTRNE
jgi:hypothetical protein